MSPETHTASAGTIDGLWRSLLANTSQLVITRILKKNLESILLHFHKGGLVSLSEKEVLEITHAPEDLSKICHFMFARRYGDSPPGDGKPIRILCRDVQRPDVASKLGMSLGQLTALRRRAEDLVCACSTLVHSRNVNAHEHYSINDPGFALMLCGSISRVIEVAEIPEELEIAVDRIRQQCDALVSACASMSAGPEEEPDHDTEIAATSDQLEQLAEMLGSISERIDKLEVDSGSISKGRNKEIPANIPKKITADDLGAKYIAGQVKRQNASLAAKLSEELRTLPTLPEIELIVQSAIEGLSDRSHADIDLEERLANILQGFEEKIEDIGTTISASSHRTEEERTELQKILDQQIEEIRQLANRSAERPMEDISEGYFLEDETPYETTSAPPTITPQQARNQLYQLRNRIRDEEEAAGTPIENWENVLQGPIIERMIGDRILNIEDWKNENLISAKYQNHKKVMKKQLKKYQNEIFEIMSQIQS